jgi:hypothetical protein
MNQTLEISLLSMIGPAIAIAVILVLERNRKDFRDEVLEPCKVMVVVLPESRITPSRKRWPTA